MYHIITVSGVTVLVKNAHDARHAAYAANERLKSMYFESVFWRIIPWTGEEYDFLIDCNGSGMLDCRHVVPSFMVN